jgi:sugar phosphate isomerase/epimerase
MIDSGMIDSKLLFSYPESAVNMNYLDVYHSFRSHFSGWEIMSELKHRVVDLEQELKQLLSVDRIKLQIHAPFLEIDLASADERIREKSIEEHKLVIGVGSRLGAELVTIHPGRFTTGKKKKHLKLNKASLGELGRFSQDHGIDLALENMGAGMDLLGSKPDEILWLLDGLDVGFCLDVGHANFSGGIGLWLGERELVQRLRNLHLHDNNGLSDEHLTIGGGNIDFERILSELSSYRWSGVIEAKSISSAVESKKRLKQIINKLK